MYARALEDEFAREVRAGLKQSGQKTLPCRYLYDDLGSALFEAITFLPDYGLSRADARILCRNAAAIVDALPRNLAVAELGSGNGTKTRPLLEALRRRQPVCYYPIDVSGSSLAKCARDLGGLAAVFPIEATYIQGLSQAAERRAPGQTLLTLFLGSTIGNFESAAATDFLYALRLCLRPGDALLLGTDLVKPVDTLIQAYDDPAGVTAAFNLNLLARINRELDADFNLRQFEHVARYDKQAQRVEMHLRSRVFQVANVRRADLVVDFAPDETICTEACHKFRLDQPKEMARLAGFRLAGQWTDDAWPFAENLMIAV